MNEERQTYKQCKLRRDERTMQRSWSQITYLPSALAVEGTAISFRERDGSWSPFFVVETVWDEELDGATIAKHRAEDISFRAATKGA
jgi:hypothetical protein